MKAQKQKFVFNLKDFNAAITTLALSAPPPTQKASARSNHPGPEAPLLELLSIYEYILSFIIFIPTVEVLLTHTSIVKKYGFISSYHIFLSSFQLYFPFQHNSNNQHESSICSSCTSQSPNKQITHPIKTSSKWLAICHPCLASLHSHILHRENIAPIDAMSAMHYF